VITFKVSVGDEPNKLFVYLDGKKSVEKPFPTGRRYGGGPEYVERYENWHTGYDEKVAIDVPPRKHEIRPVVVGKDRSVVSYVFERYLCLEESRPLHVTGFRTTNAAFLWVHNKSSIWLREWLGKNHITIEGACVWVYSTGI